MTENVNAYRIEHDSLGDMQVPADALYGVQTVRAIDNFKITGQKLDHDLIVALAQVKKAAAMAAEVYKDYNKVASFQNIEMITEWLATRSSYSFRKDKSHRLQLAITELEQESTAPENKLIFSAAAEPCAISTRGTRQRVRPRSAMPSTRRYRARPPI